MSDTMGIIKEIAQMDAAPVILEAISALASELNRSAPHTCGDDPVYESSYSNAQLCSPHAWG